MTVDDAELRTEDLPELPAPEGDEWEDEDRELSSSIALFEGDAGRLELNGRKALVALLKHRFITARTHPGEWRALIAAPELIRSRLNDLFLDLQLDTAREVAFKRQARPDGGGRFPTLLHDVAWSREETILMVQLRSRSRAEEVTGAPRVYVDREELLEHVASLRPAHATDHAGDARRAENAIDNLNRAGLLVGARGAERFEVSPAIDVVLPLERLQELLAWLQAQHAEGGGPAGGADAAEPGAEPGGGEPGAGAEAAGEAAEEDA